MRLETRVVDDGLGLSRSWRDSLNLRWPGFTYVGLVAGTLAAFLSGAHVAATALIEAQRSAQLQDLSDTALRRSEIAIDFGIAALDDLHARGPMQCDPVALQIVRLHVYQRGTVKDIRSVNRDGTVICSAYSETLEFDRGWVKREDMLPASDSDVRLFKVDQFFGVALGIQKDFQGGDSLVAILGIDSYLYDIMPTELRDHSEVVLALSDGSSIARYPSASDTTGDGGPKSAEPAILADSKSFTNASQRYPFQSAVRIDDVVFRQWHREPYIPILALGTVLGLAFGVLVAGAVTRPKGPIGALDLGLANREFKPYVQPLFELRSGVIIGGEVLARWVRSDGSVLPPSRFIPLAEGSGRVVSLTWQVMSEALRALRPWLAQNDAFKVTFNIVPDHFAARGFVRDLLRVVAAAEGMPAQIVLELTERQELGDPHRVAMVIRELRELNFGVALDDVGIGHSGLSQIQSLGANALKIDKFFIDSIDNNQTANAVVEMLVRLARELEMSIVAEGIETANQVAALIRCGVEQGQGYVVAPPMQIDEFLTFVRQRSASNTVVLTAADT